MEKFSETGRVAISGSVVLKMEQLGCSFGAIALYPPSQRNGKDAIDATLVSSESFWQRWDCIPGKSLAG